MPENFTNLLQEIPLPSAALVAELSMSTSLAPLPSLSSESVHSLHSFASYTQAFFLLTSAYHLLWKIQCVVFIFCM